jgi:hypothetical protein
MTVTGVQEQGWCYMGRGCRWRVLRIELVKEGKSVGVQGEVQYVVRTDFRYKERANIGGI